MYIPTSLAAGLLVLMPMAADAAATDNIEFVGEHLPEALQDNRFASLPIWDWQPPGAGEWQQRVALGYTHTGASTLKLGGVLASVAATRSINPVWSFTAFAFADRASFSSGRELQILQPLFAANIPLALPANATIANLGGTARDLGVGLVFARTLTSAWLGADRLLAGVIWQRMQLRNYALDYRIASGASTGVAGTLDYSASYSFVSPIVGVEWNRSHGNWRFAPHVLAAMPLPRRGVRGRIQGPGFDIRGDTAKVGYGKHVGDPFLGLGLVLTYQPLGIVVDLGSTLSQAFVEKLTHKGLDQNLMLSIEYQF
jgi:hypothetical protein